MNAGFGITNEGTLTVNSSTISDNTGYGIAVLYGSIALINGSTVSNNTNDGIFNRFSLTINSSTISNNLGRGIQNWNGGSSILNNSTVSGNKAGGFLIFSGGSIALYNSTVSNNTADTGGGIFMDFGTVILQNSILAGNTANSGPDCSGSIFSLAYNLIGNTSGCTFTSSTGDLTNIDPLLSPLQDNGGPTFTHALLPGSPAIDAGNPAGCRDQNGDLLTTDQRGVARPQGGRCDIGAFELEATGGGGEEVTIDVKPGRFPNRIKLTRNVCRDDDNVYVAILTTPTFNARTVDVSTLQLGDPNLSGTATPYRSRVTDVDRDGDRDLVLTFSLCSIVTNGALNASSTKLVLTGRTLDGNNFTGTDSVKVVR